MSNTIIRVENIGKLYKLGEIGTGTISHDLNRWWAKMRGKEDPFAKIGETNDRSSKGNSDWVWALKDINFEIKQGEVLGIIGRNGAGKSTLLKILSKVTTPSTGQIKIKGRIASLLEVGTGFHPELTGRENVFLNGAILGMSKAEIRSKFDEIVDFSGVERYIDTPVKRYSSGMYVRLAFAVAAFLEPEILIVDEVLAVGDAEFQKKCLGRMKDVSVNDGRTVLFVSHNMIAVKQLCNSAILLNNGQIENIGKVSDVLALYQGLSENIGGERNIKALDVDGIIMNWRIATDNPDYYYTVYTRNKVEFLVEIEFKKTFQQCEIGFILRNDQEEIVLSFNSRDFGGNYFKINSGKHVFSFVCNLPLKKGLYEIDIAIANNGQTIDQWNFLQKLKILDDYTGVLEDKWLGLLTEKIDFSYDKAI